ncbi:hypothetical protein [Algibacter lectus]|nr:hypothetical protein [Algibacter lectus]
METRSSSVFMGSRNYGGFKPEECVVIEDSISGVRAAKAGGFDVFGYVAHDYNNQLKDEATQTFDSMDKLLSMI